MNDRKLKEETYTYFHREVQSNYTCDTYVVTTDEFDKQRRARSPQDQLVTRFFTYK